MNRETQPGEEWKKLDLKLALPLAVLGGLVLLGLTFSLSGDLPWMTKESYSAHETIILNDMKVISQQDSDTAALLSKTAESVQLLQTNEAVNAARLNADEHEMEDIRHSDNAERERQ